jgi:hypothetical protein
MKNFYKKNAVVKRAAAVVMEKVVAVAVRSELFIQNASQK